jgi:60 kDa SS-A/Ro ribonucleoprotein
MAINYTKHQINNKRTPQYKPIPGREKEMAMNNAGGYTFIIDKWKRLERFLILSSEGGTYYVSEHDLTKANIENCIACINENPKRVLETIVKISDEGRAPKNDQAIYLLAVLFTQCKDFDVKKEIVQALPKVCRIGTHLFMFVHYLDSMRSWGRSVRSAIANWYSMSPEKLEYQMIKYQGRTVEGSNNQWTHRDVLRSAHVKPVSDKHNSLFKYAVKGEISEGFNLLKAVEELKNASEKDACKLIKEYKIPHEAWPTELKNRAKVWNSALDDLPLGALVRNLGKLSSLEILSKGKFDEINLVTKKLTDLSHVEKSRMHPLNILIAMKTYSMGHGIKGKLSWVPVQKIVDALEEMFYLSFKNVESTGKRYLLGLDVSGSMTNSYISGAQGILTCREASACMAMVTARKEQNYEVMGFSTNFVNLDITPDMTLGQTLQKMRNLPFAGTDCSVPMIWAKDRKLDFDVFVTYTDNETWFGKMHPMQALHEYRNQRIKDAKMIVVGMVGSEFSIADPQDPNSLDIVGFDSAAPQIISQFSMGKL